MNDKAIAFPIIQLKPSGRRRASILRRGAIQFYRCPECGETKTKGFRVGYTLICDSLAGCGAEMRPV